MSNINWKSKYQELKARYMTDVDTAFRLGFEQGTQKAETDSVLQQQQADAETQQQDGDTVNQGQAGEDNNSDPSAEVEKEDPADSQHPQGSELDQHISQLESMVQKGELAPADLLKAVQGFRNLQKSLKTKKEYAREMRKSENAIPGIVKALNTPAFKLGKQANHNMTSAAKSAVTMQHKIVNDVMKSWAEEEANASKSIIEKLKSEGVVAPKKD